jgi:hypothetical protein
MAQVRDIVVPKGQMLGGAGVATLTTYRKKPSASETDGLNQPLDLNNLPIDPAVEAMKASLLVANKYKLNEGYGAIPVADFTASPDKKEDDYGSP